MDSFSLEKQRMVHQSILSAIQKAHAEGQPVRELAEAAAMGKELECWFVSVEDGKEQLVIRVKE